MGEQVTAGRVLNGRRSALGLSQVDLANLTGVSRGTLRNIEGDFVTPNDRTWEALARILAWAPGGLNMINEARKPPHEVLPGKPLARILAAVIDEDRGDSWGTTAGTLGNLIASADYEGGLADEKRNELTDLILDLPIPEEDMQQVLDGIDDFLARRGEPPLRAELSLEEGDRVRHRVFGFGEVTGIESQGNAQIAVVDFGDPVGVKRLIIQHAPIQKIDEADGDQMASREIEAEAISGLADQLGLSEDIADLLAHGKIIDHESFDPRGTDNLTVLTFVLKKSSSPLSRQDRRFIGTTWGQFVDDLDQNGQADDVPAAKPATPKPTAGPISGTWKKSAGSGGFSDEPPF